MKPKPVLLSILLLLLLSACGSAAEGTQPAASQPGSSAAPQAAPLAGDPPAGTGQVFSLPSDPYRVTPSLDTASQVEALIPVSGGSLSAVAPDGTRFQLDISDRALAADTLIRMTPVSRLEGMPFGSLAYAVQLEPDGLQFFDPVMLTITPAQAIPIEEQIFFSYQGLGENLALAAPVVSSPDIQLQLLHFSGYGVTKGLLADIEPLRALIGGDAEARLQSAMAEALTRERQRQLLGAGQSQGMDVDFESYFQQFEEQVVRVRIAAAGESCAAGRLAIQTVLSFDRQRQLLGAADSSLLRFDGELMDTVASVCLKEEFEMCRDEHIIHRIIPVWLGMERQYALLGVTQEGATTPALEQAKEYVRRCLTFELQFESQAAQDDGESGGYNSSVTSKVKIQLDLDQMSNHAQAPLVNTAFEFFVPGCSVVSNRGGSTFDVYSLAYVTDNKGPADELGYVRDFKLNYFPGSTTETYSVTCDEYTYTSPPMPLWSGSFMVLHEAELSMTEGGFLAEEWEVFGNEYFAKKEWIRNDASLGLTEAGTLKLYHRPEAGK